MDAFGGAEGILAGRKRVLVKPNLVMPKKPEAAATTHPAVVAAVCRAFVKAGAEVYIIDSNIAPHSVPVLNVMYKSSGMDKAAAESGAQLCFDVATRKTERAENRTLTSFPCLAPVLDTELLVTVGKAKTHGLAYFTGTVKNLFGVLPGMEKPNIHRKFPAAADFMSAIVDICETVKPGFAVLDGVVGMEGDGPTAGTPKAFGVILGGANPHAVDLAACHLMSLRPERVPALAEAAARGLVPRSADKLTWLGDETARLITVFRPPKTERVGGFFLRHLIPKRLNRRLRAVMAKYPVISPRCGGCGECARICPQKTITMDGKKAVVDEKNCIKCYCCHEFCSMRAIDFRGR
jgi:uncharacterized protein (DUF362 family)/NAD-dependent dihydropyrimidine dehydrogenase PreA subunit